MDSVQESLRVLSGAPPPAETLEVFRQGGENFEPAPQLIAVNERCDVFVLTAGNVLAYTNLRGSRRRDGKAVPTDALFEVEFDAVEGETASSAPISGPARAPLLKRIPRGLRIRALEFDVTGDKLLVWGDSFLGVVLLPPRDQYGSAIPRGGRRAA
ncbi:unnamed protein product, partial [Phaeothamnion confervicola]